MEGAILDFEQKALKRIVIMAQERNSGARALRSILEEILMELMYDVPDLKRPNKIMITEKFVIGKSGPMILSDSMKKKSA